MRLEKLLANLGYGSRKEMAAMIREGLLTDDQGRVLSPGDDPRGRMLFFDGEPLDPPAPLVLLMNKPVGYVCSKEDPGRLVYDLMPPRFRLRKPALSPIGRLDKDTSGLLLFTDDGQFLHRIISPKAEVWKIYHVTLDRPLRGDEADIFAQGGLILQNDPKPLLPARLSILGPHVARIAIREGRYHQVRRMFAAQGNHVTALRREQIGGLTLPQDLAEGHWRPARPEDIKNIWSSANG